MAVAGDRFRYDTERRTAMLWCEFWWTKVARLGCSGRLGGASVKRSSEKRRISGLRHELAAQIDLPDWLGHSGVVSTSQTLNWTTFVDLPFLFQHRVTKLLRKEPGTIMCEERSLDWKIQLWRVWSPQDSGCCQPLKLSGRPTTCPQPTHSSHRCLRYTAV